MGNFFLVEVFYYVLECSFYYTRLLKIWRVEDHQDKPANIFHSLIGKNQSFCFYFNRIQTRRNRLFQINWLLCHGSSVKFLLKYMREFKSLSTFSVSANQLSEKVCAEWDSNTKTAWFHVSWESAVSWLSALRAI